MKVEARPPLAARVLPALIVIALGALVLLDNFGVVKSGGIGLWWPLGVIAFGTNYLVRPGSWTSGVLVTTIGVVLLLHRFGFVDLSLDQVNALWPFALIAFGFSLLVRRAPHRNIGFGVLMLALGVYFEAWKLGVVGIDAMAVGAICVLAFGAGMLANSISRR